MALLNTNDNDGNEFVSDFYFPTSKNALIIFTRNPELGKCKTRLAETVGNSSALQIYKFMLQQTAIVSKDIVADRYVYYSEAIQKNDIWDASFFRKKLQQGSDLGVRMENAFLDLFQMNYKSIIIVGSDLLDLEPRHIQAAFEALKTNDVVIGPALDGGYYLLGLSKMNPFIFKNKPWSQSNLLDETINELNRHHTIFTTLETLNDIDTYEDLVASNFYKSHPEFQQKTKQLYD